VISKVSYFWFIENGGSHAFSSNVGTYKWAYAFIYSLLVCKMGSTGRPGTYLIMCSS